MTIERFNELLNGPLSHPFPAFRITRLALALQAVVEATGQDGEDALEAHCMDRDEQDHRNANDSAEDDPMNDGEPNL